MSPPVATATGFHAFSSHFFNPHFRQRFSLHFHPPFSFFLMPQSTDFLKSKWSQHYDSKLLLGPPQSSLSRKSPEISSDNYDLELRSVLELATDSELYELERILFGPSYFSPLLKSVTKRADIDYVMIGEDMEEREEYISMLESRFLFLAADARSTLRGWRPSYRNVLLSVRKKLNIPCSAKLSAEDLEAEIFLHMLQGYSRGESGIFCQAKENVNVYDGHGSLEHGLSQWKVQAAAGVRGGAGELGSMILKGGGMLTLGKIYEVGVAGAASRYLGLRTMMTLLGPMLWGTLLADVVIQMLGTDYARILRAIYAFAQIRIIRTYKSPSDIK